MAPLVVFDCMVFLQAAARQSGPAGSCLQAVRDDRARLAISREIVDEVRDVLTRPRTIRKFPALTPEAVEFFLDEILHHSLLILNVPRTFTLPRDPKDEPYLNLAIALDAAYLVSRDRDLLDLMTDESFRLDHPGLTILDPPSFLREIGLDSDRAGG